MLMAGIGAIVTMFITFLINLSLQKDFWKEMKESFKIARGDKPLGEVKLEEMLKQKNRKR
jgi:hypothetical protein